MTHTHTTDRLLYPNHKLVGKHSTATTKHHNRWFVWGPLRMGSTLISSEKNYLPLKNLMESYSRAAFTGQTSEMRYLIF